MKRFAKYAVLLLCVTMLLSLISCGDNTSEKENDSSETAEVSDQSTDTSGEVESDTPDLPEDIRSLYLMDDAGYYDSYRFNSSTSYTAIVDKYGRETYVFPSDEELLVYANGYFISRQNEDWFLKDYSGKMVASAASLGASGFGFCGRYEHDTAFLADGYVFVYKADESYNGTKYQVGILKVDGSWLVPLSDTNPMLSSGMNLDTKEFQEEMIYVGDGCLAIKVNKEDYAYNHCVYNAKENKIILYNPGDYNLHLDYMITEIEFNDGVSYGTYQDTMYEFHTDGTLRLYETKPESVGSFGNYGFYIDANDVVYTMTSDGWGTVLVNSKGEVIKDFLDDDNVSIYGVGYRGNGTWLVSIVNNEGGYYYSIVDTTGKFLFEPIKTDAQYILMEDGASVSTTDDYGWQEYGKKIVIDETGAVLYESKEQNTEIFVKNGIVYETDEDEFNEYTRLR